MYWENIELRELPEGSGLDSSLIAPVTQALDRREKAYIDFISELVGAPKENADLSTTQSAFQAWIDQGGEITHPEHFLSELHSILWKMTEEIEGYVGELFERVDSTPIFYWIGSVLHIVKELKDLLQKRFESWISVVNPLAHQLSVCIKQPRTWKSLFSSSHAILDPKIISHLKEGEETLASHYARFEQLYREYQHESEQVHGEMEKLKYFPILALLDINEQNGYVHLFRLLRMLDLSEGEGGDQALFVKKMKQALNEIAHIGDSIQIFTTYFADIQRLLLHSSREWKFLNKQDPYFESLITALKDKLELGRVELRTLTGTLLRYRKFILSTDTDPYVGTSLGMTDWEIAPEPAPAKRILQLIYQTEEWQELFSRLQQEIEEWEAEKRDLPDWNSIEEELREMGRPLIPKSLLKKSTDRFIESVRKFNEIGTPHWAVVHFMEGAWAKALRLDARYQTLQENPLFHRLFSLHQRLIDSFEDPPHVVRMEQLKAVQSSIEKWIAAGNPYMHIHELDHTISDLKTILQDFLASIQRTYKERDKTLFLVDVVRKYRHQLLAYRYYFGYFLADLNKKRPDEEWGRYFNFIHSYLDAAERILDQFFQ